MKFASPELSCADVGFLPAVNWVHDDVFIQVCLKIVFAEPQHGFKIAFKMFDTDGNEQVDKAEFIKVKVKDLLLKIARAMKSLL